MDNEILNDLGIQNYDSVDKVLNQKEMTQQKNKKYLNKIINENQLKEHKAAITKQFNSGSLSEAARQMENKRIDNARVTMNAYIKHYENKVKTMNGFGIRKKQRGGNVVFFNNPNQLIKKLELIIGKILSGNTSSDMHNMGVSILDTLLKTSTINKSVKVKNPIPPTRRSTCRSTHHQHTTDTSADTLPTRWPTHYRHVGRNTTDMLVEILTLYNFVSSFSWKQQLHKERRKRDRQTAAIFKMKN